MEITATNKLSIKMQSPPCVGFVFSIRSYFANEDSHAFT